MDPRDNAAHALKARVVADAFDWGDDRRRTRRCRRPCCTNCTCKGFTQAAPRRAGRPNAAPTPGWRRDAAIAHLKRLGVTAVSLLPVQQHLDEPRLVKLGLCNYWGYNTIGFFCPEPALCARAPTGCRCATSSARWCAGCTQAGIEVILDVVYNHTAEADEHGPTLSLRGLDNASYYRLPGAPPEHYENHSGCGNTLDLRHPRVLQMVMDSLRYWVQEMHVDGFRFDLAPVLGRGDHGFDRNAPVLRRGGAGPGAVAREADRRALGHRPGRLPGGRLPGRLARVERPLPRRDAQLLGPGQAARAATLRCGCARRPTSSSRVAARRASRSTTSSSHDGFTLHDLLSYDHKHNQANGEHNRDGHDHNRSWNCGVEGPTDDPAIMQLRGAPAARAAGHHACWRRARRCSPPATNSATPSAATTTPTARTTRRPGSTGLPSTQTCWRFTRTC